MLIHLAVRPILLIIKLEQVLVVLFITCFYVSKCFLVNQWRTPPGIQRNTLLALTRSRATTNILLFAKSTDIFLFFVRILLYLSVRITARLQLILLLEGRFTFRTVATFAA